MGPRVPSGQVPSEPASRTPLRWMHASAASPGRLAQGEVAATGLGALALLGLLVVVLWPVLRVLGASLAGPEAVLGPGSLTILLNSLALAATSTILTVLVALALSVAMTRTTDAVRRLGALPVRLSVLSPPYLVPLGLLLLFGRDGAVSRGLGLEGSIEGFAGIVVAQVLTFLAPAVRLLTDAFARIDASLEEAAHTLGAGALTTLSRVTLALARSGLAAAALGVFVLALGDFATPFLLSGGVEVLTTAIYARAVAGDAGSAAALALLLMAPCLVASALGGSRSVGWTSGQVPAARAASAAARRVGFAVGLGPTLVVAALYAAVIVRGFPRPGPDGWSLAWPGELPLAAPLLGSLAMAVTAGIGGTALVLAVAYTADRRALGAIGTSALMGLSLLPAALPGAVLGLGYLLAFPGPAGGRLWILAACVVAGALPAAVLVARSAVARIEPAMEEAALSLGAGPAETLRRILLPLLKGPALAVFAWFFVQGLVTVSAVVFLVDPGLPLASVTGLVAARDGDLGRASTLATLLLAVAAGAMLGLRRLAGRQRVGLLAL